MKKQILLLSILFANFVIALVPVISGCTANKPERDVLIFPTTTTAAPAVTTTTIPTTITTTSTTTTTLPQLAAPNFAPVPGVYETADMTVFISHGVSSADIYYTTDGTTPDRSSNLYDPGSGITIGTSTTISAIAVADGFTDSGVAVGEFFLRWWQEVGAGLNGPVFAMAFDDYGNLYVGGSFIMEREAPIENIAVWDGEDWHPLGDGLNETVYSLAIGRDGYLYAGGSFTDSGEINLNRIARWDVSSGWNPTAGWEIIRNGFNDTVYALLPIDSGDDFLVVAGAFTMDGAEEQELDRIAIWNGTTWNSVPGGTEGVVRALAYDGSLVYAGGDFVQASVDGNNIASFSPATFDWNRLGTGTNGTVRALRYLEDGRLIVGGDFTEAGGTPVDYIAAWSTGGWVALGEGFDQRVRALANDNGTIYAGGDFEVSGSGANEVVVNHIARWNDSTGEWQPLGTGLNDRVNVITVNNGNIYVGGNFGSAAGIPAGYLAVWGIK